MARASACGSTERTAGLDRQVPSTTLSESDAGTRQAIGKNGFGFGGRRRKDQRRRGPALKPSVKEQTDADFHSMSQRHCTWLRINRGFWLKEKVTIASSY